jgi:flagellar motility protein MotE (MotC chaperone)
VNVPRILPLAAVAIVGVLGVKLLTGVEAFPDLLKGARAFAEVAAKPDKAAKAKAASPLPPNAAALPAPRPAAAVCAPTAAELAHEAGLSPGELQMLQSLGARRGQLDQREQSMDTNMQLLAAAEAKLDAKLAALASAKADIQSLLGQTDTAQAAEVNRLVGVYAAMKPRDAAARMALLSDEVRLPIAAKMKDRNLGQILAQMQPSEAKVITEKLAQRYNVKAIADAKSAMNPATPAAAPAPAPKPVQQAAATPPAKPKAAPAKPRAQAKVKPAKPTTMAANSAKPPAGPAAATPTPTPAAAKPSTTPAPTAVKPAAPAATTPAPAAKQG